MAISIALHRRKEKSTKNPMIEADISEKVKNGRTYGIYYLNTQSNHDSDSNSKLLLD